MCADTLYWSLGHSDDTDCKNKELSVRVAPGPGAVQVHESCGSAVRFFVTSKMIKLRFTGNICSAAFTESWAHPESPSQEGREVRAGCQQVGMEVWILGSQRLNTKGSSGAGTAQQVWFVTCSEVVPSH